MQLITIIFFLLAASIFDIKTKKIPIWLCVVFSILLLIESIYFGQTHSLLLAIIPSLVLFAINIVSNNGIGKGDCLVILTLAFGMSIYDILNLILYSLFFTAICGIFCFIKNRNKKQKIAFTPFIFLTFIFLMII